MDENIAKGSEELCTNCGLCCSGALFSDAPIDEGEEEKAIELGITAVENIAGKTVFTQPCPHLSGSLCSIFPNRLHICGDYHCALTLDVTSGDVSIEDASKSVKSAKEQIKWLSENARYENTDGKSKINLRNYLHIFRKKMVEQLEEGTASQIDVIYAIKALNYLKLIDASFRTTSLFIKYGKLINQMHS